MIRTYPFARPHPEGEKAPDLHNPLLAQLKTQDFDALAAYAKEQNIDLGQTTSASGAFKKIEAHILAQNSAGS